MRKISICGVPYTVVSKDDNFTADAIHFGEINYKECEIAISKGMTKELEEETLCHEIVHGIFVHIGRNDLANDEQLVQSLGNAIYGTFKVKEIKG